MLIKIRLIVSIIFVLTASLLSGLFGQWYNPENMNKKSQATYFQAIENLRAGQWETGRNLLYQTLKQEPKFVEAWLSLMGAYGEKKRYDSAILSFEKAWKMDSIFSESWLLSYTINLAGSGRFKDAAQWINRYLQTVSPESRTGKAAAYRKKTYDFALAFEEKKAGSNFSFNPVNLGDSINSSRSEYYPSFTIDDSLLVFTQGRFLCKSAISQREVHSGKNIGRLTERRSFQRWYQHGAGWGVDVFCRQLSCRRIWRF